MSRHLRSVPLARAANSDVQALRTELEDLRAAVRRLLATMKTCATRGCTNLGTHDTDSRFHMECPEHLYEGAHDERGDERARALVRVRELLGDAPGSHGRTRL